MYLLEAGQIIFSESPICIRTILGSCVSVTFFDPQTRFASMMHGLYPGTGANASYTETAISMIVKEYQKRRLPLNRLMVKLFGGANINLPAADQQISKAIRFDNVESAKQALARHNLALCKEDTGCQFGREVRFFTDTGDVYIKKICDKSVKCRANNCDDYERCVCRKK